MGDLKPTDQLTGQVIRALIVERDALRAELETARAEIAELKEEVETREAWDKAILDETCPTDEVHCTCVPALRREIERLRKSAPGPFTVTVEIPEPPRSHGFGIHCGKCPLIVGCKWPKEKQVVIGSFMIPGPGCPRFKGGAE